jgi:ADP-ribose pyrophosphatase
VSSEFELIGEETKWEGKIFRAGIERFRHADGKEVARDKVWHAGAVGIIPVDTADVWLTRQPREAVRAPDSLEIPAGKLDVAGESPLETAHRELVEEIGKQAERWEEILAYWSSPGFTDERVWLYMATCPKPARRATPRRTSASRSSRGRSTAWARRSSNARTRSH